MRVELLTNKIYPKNYKSARATKKKPHSLICVYCCWRKGHFLLCTTLCPQLTIGRYGLVYSSY